MSAATLEAPAEVEAPAAYVDDQLTEVEIDAISYDLYEKLPRIPLWLKHLYRGTVTLIAGAGGCGKGLTAIHCAATVVKGGLFPGETEQTTRDRSPGSVIIVAPEDDPNEDIAWRLGAALDGQGLTEDELKRVYDMTETEDGEPFDLNNGGVESIARLRKAIDALADTEYPVRLVIIDPLLAVCDTLSTNRQARKSMRPLMKLAKETGVAVLVTHHTVKDGKIASSKGLIDVLRLVFTAKPDPMEDDVVVLSVEKSNNLGPIGDLRYTITGTEQEPYVAWVDTSPVPIKQAWRDGKQSSSAKPKAGKGQSWRKDGHRSHSGHHHSHHSSKPEQPEAATAVPAGVPDWMKAMQQA